MKPGPLQSLGISLLLTLSGSAADLGPMPLTTRQQTIRPLSVPADTQQLCPSNVPLYQVYGYGAWQYGPGEDEGRQFLTVAEAAASTNAGTTNVARLVSFFSMSDVHLTDKESPAQVPWFGWSEPFSGWSLPGYQQPGLFGQAYSPVFLSTLQVLDTAVRTINLIHRQNPFDFGMVLGDVGNASQYNEVRWFVDVMDGQYITPSSGAHLGADTIDYQKPFQAAGLDKSIPWYEAIGNHDQMWMGVHYPTTPKLEAAYIGTNVLDVGTNLFAPGVSDQTGIYTGVVDGSTPYGDIIHGGPTNNYPVHPTVAADPNRHTLTTTNSSTTNYMAQFFNTTSYPVGHGFSRWNIESNTACYTFEPVTNLPLKVIVLDDTCKTNVPDAEMGSLGAVYAGYGWMDEARYGWLTNELQKGQDANQLMIIACHIPMNPQMDISNTVVSPQFMPVPACLQMESNMISTLHQYPNLLMLIAGHRHMNVVTPQPSPDPAHPEAGFWEIETASLRDFPRNFRTWEILRNSDNTISILTTDVDPIVEPGTPAARSRDYAVGAFRIFGSGALNDTTSHTVNAELVKTLTPAMQAVIAAYGKPLDPPVTPLTVRISGAGAVSPDCLGTSYRQVGVSYSLKAIPAPGSAFVGWTGSVATNSASLTFQMQTGTVLQANFAPVPFVATNGSYNGLFYPATGASHQNSGFINVTTGADRKFSGKLQVGGGTYSLSGQLDATGQATANISRRNQSPLTVQLEMRGSDWLIGTVSNEDWTADIIADRAVFNAKTSPAPLSGRYTLLIAGTNNGGATLPQGNGYGTLSISKAGVTSFTGSLADGTRVSQSVPVSQAGQWPLYASLYDGQGSLLGWITIGETSELGGDIAWTRPTTLNSRYPSGFAWITEMIGARYNVPTKGFNVFESTNSSLVLTLDGGGLSPGITNSFTLDGRNHVKQPTLAKRLSLAFNPSTGLFTGSQAIPGMRQTLSFKGAIVQGQVLGGGYFLGTDQSGGVWMQTR